jgi:Xaa-Pro aminopeptidase
MPQRTTTQALEQLPRKLGLDAVIAMSPENFAYVSGAYVLTVKMIRPRQAFAVLPAKRKPFIVVCSIELSLTKAESWIEDIRTYTEFVDDPIDALVAQLKAEGLTSGRMGIDKSYIPVASWERLTAALPGVTFVDTTEAISAIRAIKSDDEVRLLEETTKQTHRATLDAMAASKLGDSERDMANRIATNIITNGADGTLFICFASGQRSGQPHTAASPDVYPKPGEVIRFDVGGTYGAWASDFARTYSAGDPTKLQRDTYSKLIDIQTATIEHTRPGLTAEDLFFFCKNAFDKHGLPFHMPHIGHSFGVELHENPMLRPGDKTRLEPGMVLNIEPIARASDGSVFHTEDLILVTDTGYRLLTLGLAPRDIPVIGETLKY